MKKNITFILIVCGLILFCIGMVVMIHHAENYRSTSRTVIGRELDRTFQRFADSGGHLARSHREANMPTSYVMEKLEAVVLDEIEEGQTARIVVTGINQWGIGFPRINLLVGVYADEEFQEAFTLVVIATDGELERERCSRREVNERNYETRIADLRRQNATMWEYTKEYSSYYSE